MAAFAWQALQVLHGASCLGLVCGAFRIAMMVFQKPEPQPS